MAETTRRISSVGKLQDTYVYIAIRHLGNGSLIKIGMSSNPASRVKNMRGCKGGFNSLYVSNVPCEDIALAHEIEHDILSETIESRTKGEWRFFPSHRPWLIDRMFDAAETSLRLSLGENAAMERWHEFA